ncbi:TIR domain-containing protein [Flavilitoribacter nigricans]|uniref:TIR domain-containing protein n=1 Tax=Flavilitoribacter nigricans (strain ATCC 23147 / DSM 23189 / NBRC 102662 / NCIMB 1420 / SS-2) TaxID=1122177 RepID=A0A2D0MWZ3_FLAN2|nr:TIR domain-containing protein [Flavilitoribacter nigricans]PHN00700.1 hypothetical protein CRP01_40825 [Flavilitoribacter nigricans DSM 23189 = NBRC 102662]
MPQHRVQIPLAVHIFWQDAGNDNAKDLRKYANHLYDFLNRNTADPLDRYLEIPVFLLPNPPEHLDELQLEQCQYSLNIFLIDDAMVLDQGGIWGGFFEKLAEKVDSLGPYHKIYPVALTDSFVHFHPQLASLHAVRLYTEKTNRRNRFLYASVANFLSRLLYMASSGRIEADQNAPPLPIQLFISHAKLDGEVLAKRFKDHLVTIFDIGAFFDDIHMIPAWSFSDQIEQRIQKSVLLVIHTDSYSSREWCRREFLMAKKFNRPILVVNRFELGELRSFPYIGNVPHIHYNRNDIDEEGEYTYLLDYILIATLRETLRFKYNEIRMDVLAETFGVNVEKVIAYPPELVTLLHSGSKNNLRVVLYPDPPLGAEEMELLELLQPQTTFLTPALLALVSDEGKTMKYLENLKVGISLSNPILSPISEFQNRGIQDLMVDITKYLLVSGASLVYSGDLKYKEKNEKKSSFNYTELLIDLAATYQKQFNLPAGGRTLPKPLQAHPFFPGFDDVDIKTRASLKDLVDFVDVSIPQIPGLDEDQREEIRTFKTFYHKMVWAESLYLMRKEVEKEEAARVFLGGKWINFRGRMPGVLEEFLISMEQKQPIFLVGGYGGVTAGIAAALQGKDLDELTLPFYEREYPEYVQFLEEYNPMYPERAVDFPAILKWLHEKGRGGDDFGLNNGLTREENLILFHSRFAIEIVSLILKGLKKIKSV